jgi:mRNA interferase YafQ
LEGAFIAVVLALANDWPLSEKHRAHALIGEWQDHRDCHINPDLTLIYRKPTDDLIQFFRLGSHGELGL